MRLTECGTNGVWLAYLLWPISILYRIAMSLRRLAYESGLMTIQQFDVPIVIVGNITVGGTGKTPIVAAIARYLNDRGWKPGIVSRGYGGHSEQWPQEVQPTEFAERGWRRSSTFSPPNRMPGRCRPGSAGCSDQYPRQPRL